MNRLLLRTLALVLLTLTIQSHSGAADRIEKASATTKSTIDSPAVRTPLGPDELPESLAGRWKVSLCVSTEPSHAWIRFENPETGEVRTVSRYHLFVGGWFGPKQFRWNYGLTMKTGVYMDREQSLEQRVRDGRYLMLSAYVNDPVILRGSNDGHGHGMVVNNCVTYTRDAWQEYTGEYYPLPKGAHTPSAFRNCILHRHPEVLDLEEGASAANSTQNSEAGRATLDGPNE